ncbi:Dual-specificity kinase, spindle pole body (SPB) duplication and spindle checkpoint function [Coemansia sp. RSA 552]|nr:Dual-specificity kinase, spindle pole body (SPB) duplication and spindle checkpoint function [Coemansia sp. RSA 552]
MSLYGYDSSRGEAQQAKSVYPSLVPERKPGSRLFDLPPVDDFDIDSMSDLDNLSFGNSRRPADMPAGRSQPDGSFQLVSSPKAGAARSKRASFNASFDEFSLVSGETHIDSRPSNRAGQSRAGGQHPADGESPGSPGRAGAEALDGHQDATKYYTPASQRSQVDAGESTRPPAAAAAAKAAGSSMETPAYRMPPHPKTLGSTVTTRWKRRGRLGLAKPKRAVGGPSDDSTNNGDGEGIEPSPPSSLDFFAASSGSIDRAPSDGRLAMRPPSPRSYASGFGSMDSLDGEHRSSVVYLDEIVAGDVEHTFQGPRSRRAGKGHLSADGSQESIRPAARTAASSHEASAAVTAAGHGRPADVSDVSMNSNPRSRPHSPAYDKSPPVDANLLPSSSGRRVAETKPPGSNGRESRDQLLSESARRRAMSPPLGRQRPPVPSPGSRSSENISHRADTSAGSPMSESPRVQALRFGANAVKPEVRLSAFGDSAMDISTRFQQYEKRMNDLSPQFRSPRERQRSLNSASRGNGSENSSPDQPPDPSGRNEGRSRPESGNRSSSHRQHGASSIMRNSDWRNPPVQQPNERPGYYGTEYISPKLSARRTAEESNFDAFRNSSTPVGQDQPDAMQLDSNPGSRAGGARSGSKSQVSPFAVPAASGRQVLQEQYASAAAQASQQQQQQQKQQPLSADLHPRATSSPREQPQQQQQQQPPPLPLLPASAPVAPTPSQNQQASAQPPAQASVAHNGMDPKRMLTVNSRPYQKISITGRGGSSKVYKAMSAKHEIFAIKRVSFSRADVQAIEGYVNEIILLRKFEGNPYIVQLFDAEINKERGLLHMVMEFGETDLASVLKRNGARPLGMNVVRLYWEQMLRSVLTIHEERVVHADLKPANYLLVKGSLKLIDFGIAKAIGNDTTNIHRENQVGTVNYMSPEAIKETNADNGRRLMKLGRASDIWSLGIILYQMCYGRTPFAQLALFKKLASIPDPAFVIPYPAYMAGCLQVGTDRDPNADTSPKFSDGTDKIPVPSDLQRVMRVCLQRDPEKRMTIPDLLVDPLLCPIALDQVLPSAMSQVLSLLKANPHVLEQWNMDDAQNERILGSLIRELHQREQNR